MRVTGTSGRLRRAAFGAAFVWLLSAGSSMPFAQAPAPSDEAPDEPDRSIPSGYEELDPGWYALIDTSFGNIVAKLLPEQAPQSVAHFAALAEGRLEWIDPFTGEMADAPYYDGVEVHRIVAGQRFEVGDRTATGRGAAPVYVPQELGAVDFSKPYRLGMTRAPLGRISGSLFFVTADAQPFLSRRHPCFGVVVDGDSVIRNITRLRANSSGKPLERVLLERVRIFGVGDPEPLPEPSAYVPPVQQFRPRMLESPRGRPPRHPEVKDESGR